MFVIICIISSRKLAHQKDQMKIKIPKVMRVNYRSKCGRTEF